MGGDWYPVCIAAFASIGTFLYGFDTGIATTTIAHQSWINYMGRPSNGLTGAVVSTYIAGSAAGSIGQILLLDKLGRKQFMQLACVLVTIATSIQTASVNFGMFLAGRILAGMAVGALSATVPVYLSEIGSPKTRGLIGGLGGVGISAGAMTANWVGFAGSYASYGQVQWRVPLGIQIPWGIILIIGLFAFMPDSPRQLIQKGHIEQARKELFKIRSGLPDEEVHKEFEIMRGQIQYEMGRKIPSFTEIFKVYRRRVFVCIAVQIMTSLTGVNVIQYFQTTLYKRLGMNQRMILALAGVYGTCAFLANAVANRFLPDRWGRRKMLLAGLTGVILVEIYCAVMQREFQHTNNRVGKGFAILGIYTFAVIYYSLICSVTWLYAAEVVPMFIRSKMVGASAFAHYTVNIGVTQAGPSAFASINENYYYVFVGCCSVFLVLVYLYFPETKSKTLEEIAAAFGDKVVEIGDDEVYNDGVESSKIGAIRVGEESNEQRER